VATATALCLTAPAHAQTATPTPPTPAKTATAPITPKGGLTGIDAMTATVFEQDQSSFAGLAIRARLQSKRLLPSIDFMPTMEYWRNSSKVDAFDLRTVRRDATLGVDGRWTFDGEAWRVYAGAGMAVHFLSGEVDSPTLKGKDALTKGGLTLLGGIAFGSRTSPLGNFIEVKSHLVGDFEQLKINLGLSWNR
jgi:hypothetical protein